MCAAFTVDFFSLPNELFVAVGNTCDISSLHCLPDGTPPLNFLVGNGYTSCLPRYLQSHPDNINEKDGNGSTALHIAASKHMLQAARLLCRTDNVDLDTLDKDGQTPLMVAVRCRDTFLVDLLLDVGADVNKQESMWGKTPLHAAIEAEDLVIAESLLKKGADTTICDIQWYGAALHVAAAFHGEAMVSLLLPWAYINERDSDGGGTPLHWAAKRGTVEVFKLLLENGADAYAFDNERYMAHMWFDRPTDGGEKARQAAVMALLLAAAIKQL